MLKNNSNNYWRTGQQVSDLLDTDKETTNDDKVSFKYYKQSFLLLNVI